MGSQRVRHEWATFTVHLVPAIWELKLLNLQQQRWILKILYKWKKLDTSERSVTQRWGLWFHLYEALEQTKVTPSGKKKKKLEQRLPLARGDGGRLRRGWERERTWWREGNVCGWRLVYTGACIGQNSAIVQLMLMHCALANFTFKEKKHISQYWTLVNDLHAEIFKGDVTWRQLVFKNIYWSMALVVVAKNQPASAGGAKNLGSVPELEGSPGGGTGNPLQYSWLENSPGGGAW